MLWIGRVGLALRQPRRLGPFGTRRLLTLGALPMLALGWLALGPLPRLALRTVRSLALGALPRLALGRLTLAPLLTSRRRRRRRGLRAPRLRLPLLGSGTVRTGLGARVLLRGRLLVPWLGRLLVLGALAVLGARGVLGARAVLRPLAVLGARLLRTLRVLPRSASWLMLRPRLRLLLGLRLLLLVLGLLLLGRRPLRL